MDAAPFGLSVLGLVASGLLLYFSGNLLNDWKDRHWDAEHRPERALPRGWFTPAFYVALASITGLSGLAIAAAIDPICLGVAIGIAICIMLYTWLHKITPWAVVFMGACRAFLPVLGFLGARACAAGNNGGDHVLALVLASAGLFIHIAGLSLHARREALRHLAHRGPTWLFFPVAAALAFVATSYDLALPLATCLAALVPYGLWTGFILWSRKISLSGRVSGLLAGIPWLDGVVLMPLVHMHQGKPVLSFLILAIPPVVFVLSRALQRITPAT